MPRKVRTRMVEAKYSGPRPKAAKQQERENSRDATPVVRLANPDGGPCYAAPSPISGSDSLRRHCRRALARDCSIRAGGDLRTEPRGRSPFEPPGGISG